MLSPLTLVQTEARPAAVIRLTIPREQIRVVMGPAMMEVIAAATSQGLGPAGPLFSHHFKMSPDVFDFEVGVPVSSALTPTGRVIASEIPAARVARTVYTGGYEELGEAWGEFMGNIEAAGHQAAPNLWEVYLKGPESGEDSAAYQTELNRPLVS